MTSKELHDLLFLELHGYLLWRVFLCRCHVSCQGQSRRGLRSWEEGVEPKIQPRAQSSAQGLMGHLPKIVESQDYGGPSEWEQQPKKAWQDNIANKKPKE